jgi:hypothetical protein
MAEDSLDAEDDDDFDLRLRSDEGESGLTGESPA